MALDGAHKRFQRGLTRAVLILHEHFGCIWPSGMWILGIPGVLRSLKV